MANERKAFRSIKQFPATRIKNFVKICGLDNLSPQYISHIYLIISLFVEVIGGVMVRVLDCDVRGLGSNLGPSKDIELNMWGYGSQKFGCEKAQFLGVKLPVLLKRGSFHNQKLGFLLKSDKFYTCVTILRRIIFFWVKDPLASI
jgi:hypothetical protein